MVHGKVLLDPSGEEERRASGGVAVASMPSLHRVTQIMHAHAMPMNHSQEVWLSCYTTLRLCRQLDCVWTPVLYCTKQCNQHL